MYYILTDSAIESIKNDPILKAKLELVLKMSGYNIYRICKLNLPNNDLTKPAATDVICSETGMDLNRVLKREGELEKQM